MDCRDCTMAVQKVSRAYLQSFCGMQSSFQRRASQHPSTSWHLSSPTSPTQHSSQASYHQTSMAALSPQSSRRVTHLTQAIIDLLP